MTLIHRWRRLVAVSLFSVLFFGACSLSDAAAGKVQGKVQYEKILFRNPKTGAAGLDLAHPVLRPVAGAKVELVDSAAKVLARGVTDANGAYNLSWSAAAAPSARVRVIADADNAVIVDYFDASKTYFVASDAWTLPDGVASKDIVAKDKTRDSGPFNILAVLQIGNKMLRAAEPGIAIPRVTIRWTIKAGPTTSFFSPATKKAVILGDRAVDSDEFDDVIILHEYGHFIAFFFAKDDSMGDTHNLGEKIDPRLAWGEGWGNFFACAALNDPNYIDTGASGVRIQYSLDDDTPKGDQPGYWSEHTVGGVLWDIFDKRAGKNHLGCGFGEIWRALRSKAWSDLPPYRHLIDFCDIFVARNPGVAKGVTAILAARGITYTPGKTPSVPNPFVHPLKSGPVENGDLNSRTDRGSRWNMLDAVAVYSFTLKDKKKVNLHLDIVSSKDKKNADLDLYLVGMDGKTIQSSRATNGVGGNEDIATELPAGRYFIEVRSWSGPSTARVTNTGAFKLRADF